MAAGAPTPRRTPTHTLAPPCRRPLAWRTAGGGPYAASYASLFPEHVESLVLISAVGPTDWSNLPLLRAMRGADLLQFSLVRLPPMGGLWTLHAVMAYMAKVGG